MGEVLHGEPRGEGALREDEFFFMQLPQTLPFVGSGQDKEIEEGEGGRDLGGLGEVGEGQIGTLQFLENGEVKLKIGDILYEVDVGVQTNFS